MPGNSRDSHEDLRFRILRSLHDNPNASYRGLAREAGVSVGGVHYCVNALIDKGLVKVRNFKASENKIKYAYILTPKGIAEKTRLTSNFLKRKLREYEALRSEMDAIRQELDTGSAANTAPVEKTKTRKARV
jgi:EPS-associated MarR family transcriptional regulator